MYSLTVLALFHIAIMLLSLLNFELTSNGANTNLAGKIYETGSFGISSLKGHNKRRIKCLNDFVSLYGKMPLVSTNVKAVDARDEWFW